MTLKTHICFTFQILLKVPNQIIYRWGKFFPLILDLNDCDVGTVIHACCWEKATVPLTSDLLMLRPRKNKAAIRSRAIEGQHEHECVVLCLGEENLVKHVVVGRFWPLNAVYGLASGPCGVIDDGREVLLDDDAKKSPPSLWPQKFKEVRTDKINSISVLFTF